MLPPTDIRKRTNSYVVLLFIGLIVTIYLPILAYAFPAWQRFRIPITYLLPIALIGHIVIAGLIYWRGQGELPIFPFIAGLVWVFGGAAADMIATAVRSPNLDREANVIARVLLDSGHTVEFVYAFAVVAQFLLQLLIVVLWAAFLRHRETLVALAWDTAPKSCAEFIKAAMGGEGLTWWEYFRPYKKPPGYYSRTFYHGLGMLPMLGFWLGLYRWYLAANWFDLVPRISDNVLIILLIFLTMVSYISWLAFEYSNGLKNK